MTTNLDGRVVLITGTAMGQGRAAAVRFAEAGAVVVGGDVEAAANAETVALVTAAGGRMTGIAPVDLGDPADAQRFVDEAVAAAGRIDVLYNNASAARWGTIADMSYEDWQFTIRNELDLLFLVTKAAWPHLAERGGVIINTSSVAGRGGGPGGVAHSTTKAGVLAMTHVMAAEGGPVGIRAVSISPGVIETPGSAEQLSMPGVKEMLLARSLVPRMGVADDIAKVAVFLASDDAAFITGTDVLVDGGLTNA